MTLKGYRPNEGNFVILECKTCGMRQKALKKQIEVMKIRCRNCHGTRWRRLDAQCVTEATEE